MTSDWLEQGDFRTADVSPMSVRDVERFVTRWHQAMQAELARQGKSREELTEVARDLNDKLQNNASLSQLATNPLLCAMICALHRDRHQKLPEEQNELCEALCHMLLHRRERESGLDWLMSGHIC